MHVAFWSPGWPLKKFQNGIVTYVHWTQKELQRRGHEVSVFTGEGGPSAGEIGVSHVQMRPARWRNLAQRLKGHRFLPGHEVFRFSESIAAAMARVHQRNPIDIVDMEESFGWFADIESATSIPTLPRLHGPAFLSLVQDELQTPFSQEKIAREGRALSSAKALTSPCALTLKQTIERYGLKPLDSRVIANPINVDSDTPVWDLKRCRRDTILFVGRIDLRKGADIVLKAFHLLSENRHALNLVMVGPDRGILQEDGTVLKYADYCKKVLPPGFENRVSFLGPRENREIAQLRTRAMVTVIASRWENQGYTVLEAMLQGCPVVSSDAGGIPEYLEDGISGRLARSEDPADFARKLGDMLDDPQAAAALGATARRNISDRHSTGNIIQELLQMYDRRIALQSSTTGSAFRITE
jgi:glycosyltransferase involved in cell wall biosynthesis